MTIIVTTKVQNHTYEQQKIRLLILFYNLSLIHI